MRPHANRPEKLGHAPRWRVPAPRPTQSQSYRANAGLAVDGRCDLQTLRAVRRCDRVARSRDACDYARAVATNRAEAPERGVAHGTR